MVTSGGLRGETIHHYLETVFYIANEGEVVRPGRIATWLGVSAPTVSSTLQRLERGGWITIADDRSVAMTPSGERIAADVVRRHRLLERWLTDVLGFDWATADEEAQRLVEGLSADVADRLDAHLGHPQTCPHGNVIPGREPPYRDLVALSDLRPGEAARVRRISEVAEHDAPQLLRHLEELGIMPGARVARSAMGLDEGALAVEIDGQVVAVGRASADAIWVELEDGPGA
jgi:DtxR family Mn-dependent transcriptional regulator